VGEVRAEVRAGWTEVLREGWRAGRLGALMVASVVEQKVELKVTVTLVTLHRAREMPLLAEGHDAPLLTVTQRFSCQKEAQLF